LQKASVYAHLPFIKSFKSVEFKVSPSSLGASLPWALESILKCKFAKTSLVFFELCFENALFICNKSRLTLVSGTYVYVVCTEDVIDAP
jgi:hypothetical protein